MWWLWRWLRDLPLYITLRPSRTPSRRKRRQLSPSSFRRVKRARIPIQTLIRPPPNRNHRLGHWHPGRISSLRYSRRRLSCRRLPNRRLSSRVSPRSSSRLFRSLTRSASPRPILCWTRPARGAAGRRARIWATCTTMEAAWAKTACARHLFIPSLAVHLHPRGVPILA